MTVGSSSTMAWSRFRASASSCAHSITRWRPEAFSADWSVADITWVRAMAAPRGAAYSRNGSAGFRRL
ncbi:hypothetical protein [Streptomyces sp. NBC_01483]|uniref:hypothetical protein n=1 Tax=Streptomyces sp. NBC_01483 TaxID=2903883 RepID=UPI002E35609E|nr:hypothetical protein [Streptomyces sp. NBC_01483]